MKILNEILNASLALVIVIVIVSRSGLVDLYAGLSVIISLQFEGFCLLCNFLNKPSPWWTTNSVDVAA